MHQLVFFFSSFNDTKDDCRHRLKKNIANCHCYMCIFFLLVGLEKKEEEYFLFSFFLSPIQFILLWRFLSSLWIWIANVQSNNKNIWYSKFLVFSSIDAFFRFNQRTGKKSLIFLGFFLLKILSLCIESLWEWILSISWESFQAWGSSSGSLLQEQMRRKRVFSVKFSFLSSLFLHCFCNF